MKFESVKKKLAMGMMASVLVLALQGCGNSAEVSGEIKDSGTTSTEETSEAAGETTEETSESTDERVSIRIGGDSGRFSYAFRVAAHAGIFDKYNIDATVDTYSYGIDTINAVILGEEDAGEAMDYAACTRLPDSNLRIVAYIGGPTETGDGELCVQDESIQKPEDLVGKKIAVQKGTVAEYKWAKIYETFNIDKSQVEEVYLSSDTEILAAFEAGNVDAALLSPSQIEKVQGSVDYLGQLGTCYELTGFLSQGYLCLDKTFIEEHEDAVGRILLALDEAGQFIQDNPEEAANYIYDDLKISAEEVLKEIPYYYYEVSISQDDVERLGDMAKWVYDNEVVKTSYDINDYLELDAIKEVLPDKVSLEE